MSIDFTLPHCCTAGAAMGNPGHVLIMATIIMRPLCSIQMDTGLRRWLTKRRNAGFQQEKQNSRGRIPQPKFNPAAPAKASP